MAFYRPLTIETVIPSGQSQSGSLDVGGLHLVSLVMPDAWTAGALTFLASHDGVTFVPVVSDAGAELSFAVAANRLVRFPAGFFIGAPFFRLRSGNTATPVAQAAARTFRIYARDAA